MTQHKVIRAVAGDRGGWNAIRPVLVRTADEGYQVKVSLVGASAEQVKTGQLELDARFQLVDEPISSKNTVTVLGMSQSKEGIAAIVEATLNASGPVVGIQDYYGSALPLLKALQQANKLDALTLLCVNDQVAQEHIAQQGFALSTIKVTGNPHFDQVAVVKQNWSSRRQELRKLLGLSDQELLFLVVGQPNGTAEILRLLEAGLLQVSLSQPEHVLVRMHPRATPDNQQAMTEYYATTSYTKFVTVSPEVKLSSDDLLPAADFVLSGYSTTNHFAVLYEMPGLMYVKTPALQQDLLRDTGLEKPLEVQAGAAWYITEPSELAHAITEVLAQDTSSEAKQIRTQQQNIAQYNNGQATERCWSELKSLLDLV